MNYAEKAAYIWVMEVRTVGATSVRGKTWQPTSGLCFSTRREALMEAERYGAVWKGRCGYRVRKYRRSKT